MKLLQKVQNVPFFIIEIIQNNEIKFEPIAFINQVEENIALTPD